MNYVFYFLFWHLILDSANFICYSIDELKIDVNFEDKKRSVNLC